MQPIPGCSVEAVRQPSQGGFTMSRKLHLFVLTALVSLLAAPVANAAAKEFTFGLDGGVIIPSGDYADGVKQGFRGGVFGDYWMTGAVGLGVDLNYNQNKAKDLGPGESGKASIIQASVHAKWMPEMKDSPLSPFGQVGVGLYSTKFEFTDASGTSDTTLNKVGFNVGAGVNYKLNPQFSLGLGGDFHMVPSALEVVDVTTGKSEKKALQAITVQVNLTFGTSGAK
jgi:opacity protein-like surface antigen